MNTNKSASTEIDKVFLFYYDALFKAAKSILPSLLLQQETLRKIKEYLLDLMIISRQQLINQLKTIKGDFRLDLNIDQRFVRDKTIHNYAINHFKQLSKSEDLNYSDKIYFEEIITYAITAFLSECYLDWVSSELDYDTEVLEKNKIINILQEY